MKKTLKQSKRGLTFSLDQSENFPIGMKYRYFINKESGEIIIIPDKNGKHTVSRKKSGKRLKPLFDIRSKEVKELCIHAEYMEVVVETHRIIVKTYVKKHTCCKIINFQGKESLSQTGEIVLERAVGQSDITYNSKKDTGTFDQEIEEVYRVASFFSGAGLLDYSFKDPHFKFVYAADFDENACETYRHNIGSHIVCKDIREIKSEEVPDADIMLAGICCQGYSNSNRKSSNTEKGRSKRLLVDDFIRIVKERIPKIFVIENVEQFLTKEKGLYYRKVKEGLPQYEITKTILNDGEIGGYTLRKRMILIGSLIGKIEIPKIKLHIRKCVRDALSKVNENWPNFHDVSIPSKDTIKKMMYVPQGGNWRDIPTEICTFSPSTHSDRYRRLSWDELAPTIVNWRKVIMMPPVGNRILSVSEAAALMGLDKDFKIYGKTLDSRQQQIGNGVTQQMGRLIKDTILKALNQFSQIINYRK